jgi:hypothetical protein
VIYSVWGLIVITFVCTVTLIVAYSITLFKIIQGSRYAFVAIMVILELISQIGVLLYLYGNYVMLIKDDVLSGRWPFYIGWTML